MAFAFRDRAESDDLVNIFADLEEHSDHARDVTWDLPQEGRRAPKLALVDPDETADEYYAEAPPEGLRGLASLGALQLRTKIVTNRGEIMARRLQAGDMILTRDNGYQPVRWVGRFTVTSEAFAADPDARLVRIPAGALEGGSPEEPIEVSASQLVMMSDHAMDADFGGAEVLVPARDLIGRRGIAPVAAEDMPAQTVFLQILTACHELILANGAWCATMMPDARNMSAYGAEERAEIAKAMPELGEMLGAEAIEESYPHARLVRNGAILS